MRAPSPALCPPHLCSFPERCPLSPLCSCVLDGCCWMRASSSGSENHTPPEVEIMQCKPGSKQGQAEDVFHGLAWLDVGHLQRGRISKLPGQPFPVFDHHCVWHYLYFQPCPLLPVPSISLRPFCLSLARLLGFGALVSGQGAPPTTCSAPCMGTASLSWERAGSPTRAGRSERVTTCCLEASSAYNHDILAEVLAS